MSVVNPTKTLISKAPDVTVIVGSGVNARGFRCYGDMLAAASPVLNAMLSCGMKESETKRIELPDKDPEEWELVLQCIDNASPLLFQLNEVDDNYDLEPRHDEPINFSNVSALVPWFHELQMDKHLCKCDLVASRGPWSSLSTQDSVSEEDMTELFDVLSLSIKYNLEHTIKTYCGEVRQLMARCMWGWGGHDHFSLPIIQCMVDIFHPFKLQELQGSPSNKLVPCHPSLESLWDCVSISLDLSSLSFEIANDEGMFSQTLHHSLHLRHLRMKSDFERLTSNWIGKEGLFYMENLYGDKFRIHIAGATLQESDILQHLGNFNEYHYMMGLRSVIPGKDSCYELSNDMKTLCLVTNHINIDHNISDDEEEKDINAPVTQPRQIRSSDPDLIVQVGSGESMKEILCHSAILASASTQLDLLISKASGILVLPQLHPDGWELFCEFINPGNNGDCLNHAKYGPVERSMKDEYRRRDIKLLLPFFQAFDMANHLMCCEKILESQIDGLSLECYEFEGVVDILALAIEHNLASIKQLAEEELSECWPYLEFIKDVKLVTMELLVSVCLPVKRNSTHAAFTSTSCPLLWREINSRIKTRFEALRYLEIGRHECELFTHLVHSYLMIETMEN